MVRNIYTEKFRLLTRILYFIASVQRVENAAASTRMLAQTTLRNILGLRTLQGILSDREAIARELLKILDEATDPWGKDLRFH